MTSKINGQSTRLTVKDDFNSNREIAMSQFLKQMNQVSTQNIIPNDNSSDFPQSTKISNINPQMSLNNSPSYQTNPNYTNISKTSHTPQYQQITSDQFDKLVNQKVDTLENFRIPQDSKPDNKDYIQNPPDDINAYSQKVSPPSGVISGGPLMSTNLSSIPTTSSSEISKKQLYTPEIGDKRRLSNIIYQSLIKTYKKINHQFISQLEIEDLLAKYQLTGIDNKDKIRDFVVLLRNTINKNISVSEQINDSLMLREDSSSTEIKPNSETNSLHNHLFEKETKENVYNLLIDTRDRDKTVYPYINHFCFSFGGHNVFSRDKENVGYIDRNFNNVKSAELVEVIIPRETHNGDRYQFYPYLLIDIEEFGNSFQGTNESLSSAFGKISFGKVIGNYAYYNAPEDNNQLKKYFNPRISLSKITIRIKKPNGELFNFGENIMDHSNISVIYSSSGKIPQDPNDIHHTDSTNDSIVESDEGNQLLNNLIQSDNLPGAIESNITLLFKITCLQRSLDTMFLDKRDS